jgi:hypothetical protein
LSHVVCGGPNRSSDRYTNRNANPHAIHVFFLDPYSAAIPILKGKIG